MYHSLNIKNICVSPHVHQLEDGSRHQDPTQWQGPHVWWVPDVRAQLAHCPRRHGAGALRQVEALRREYWSVGTLADSQGRTMRLQFNVVAGGGTQR